jgi:hypothetical protein
MKKIALLALALVLALGSLGFAYAMWYEDLFIEGTVYTGNLDADWSLDGYGDDETKDYSYVEAYIIGDTLYVYVDNAYPCINYYVNFDVYNAGTIPFHVCDLVCTGPGQFPGTCTITQPTPFQVHPGEHAWGTISIHLDNQYDPQELTYYFFSCELKAVQYTEPCPTPG